MSKKEELTENELNTVSGGVNVRHTLQDKREEEKLVTARKQEAAHLKAAALASSAKTKPGLSKPPLKAKPTIRPKKPKPVTVAKSSPKLTKLKR